MSNNIDDSFFEEWVGECFDEATAHTVARILSMTRLHDCSVFQHKVDTDVFMVSNREKHRGFNRVEDWRMGKPILSVGSVVMTMHAPGSSRTRRSARQ